MQIDMSDESMQKQAREQIQLLNAELAQHRHNYYVLAAPTISDADYDKKEKELKSMVELYPAFRADASILFTVGSDLADAAGRVKHLRPMLSLDNAYTLDELMSWVQGLPADASITIEPKVDGCSCSLKYVNRVLVQALSRGDGTYGEDITAAAIASSSIPKTLSKKFPATLVEIRGEIFITEQHFTKLCEEAVAAGDKPWANARNLAAGSTKLKDASEIARRDLKFQPWEVLGLDVEGAEALSYVNQHGQFRQDQVIRVRSHNVEEVTKQLEMARNLRETLWHVGLGMKTDGAVFKVNEAKLRKQMGHNGKTVEWGIAYKWPSERAQTTLNSITWQVGRSGKLTPVAEVAPVSVGGTTVSRINCNNWTWMEEKGLKLGATVTIFRGGEVIPQIEGVVGDGGKDIPAPAKCPFCTNDILVYDDPRSNIRTFWCENEACGGRMIDHFTYIADRKILNLDGLGDQFANKMVREEFALNLGDLYQWQNETMPLQSTDWFDDEIKSAGFSVAQVRTLLKSMETSKKLPWDKWLQALGIPGLGSSMGTNLAMHLRLQSQDMKTLVNKLIGLTENAVDGLGPNKLKNIHDWAFNPKNRAMIEQLADAGVVPTALIGPATAEEKTAAAGPAGPLGDYTIVVTGEFPWDREEIHKALKSLGATIKTGVSKKVNLLLIGSAPGRTKLTKAKELNIRMEKKPWLDQVLSDGGIELEHTTGLEVDDSMDDL